MGPREMSWERLSILYGMDRCCVDRYWLYWGSCNKRRGNDIYGLQDLISDWISFVEKFKLYEEFFFSIK